MSNTEYESKNESATTGDWIIQNNPLNKKERYVVKEAKFQELYDVENGVELGDVTLFQARNNVIRKCVIITKELFDHIEDVGMRSETLTQTEMYNVCTHLKKLNCRKTSTVAAWQWSEKDGEVETHVLKSNNEHLLDFVAPWGSEMPLKMYDAIIVMEEEECYRIAQAEFERTYEILNDLG